MSSLMERDDGFHLLSTSAIYGDIFIHHPLFHNERNLLNHLYVKPSSNSTVSTIIIKKKLP